MKTKISRAKNVLAVVLSLILIISSFPITALALVSDDGLFEYSVTPEDAAAMITGYKGEATEVEIPEIIETNGNKYEVQSVNMNQNQDSENR